MGWAKVALVSGVLVVLGAFGVGTEVSRSATMADHVQHCGSAISASWLVSGTPEVTTHPDAEERAAAAACAPVIRQSQLLVLTAIGLGGLLAVLGATALRPPVGLGRPRQPAHA
ncbi:multisubunit Na+/H+ antiporter MnhC subunit [Nocardioides sp. BE266]|uniref:hypothetical protein n=1 Tax=Nocardioides sp. BE266 TaxID=2817725 RepID=UPI0028638EAA|nr:hypothetical protein [Nocardioides sp. BE266]MDR7251055.1 multisubunit Na+/H+ antiporter MnhC subunit [Nocardioides sp. BE266]